MLKTVTLALAGVVLIAPMARAELATSHCGGDNTPPCFYNASQPYSISLSPQGSSQVLVSSGAGATFWASPPLTKPTKVNTMETIGVFATVAFILGGVIAVVMFTLWTCETLKALKERVSVLEIPGAVTDAEIENVMAATTREEAHDAIIALRT